MLIALAMTYQPLQADVLVTDGDSLGRAIEIVGEIKQSDVEKLRQALKIPTYSIGLDSPGGDLDAALEMGDIIYNATYHKTQHIRDADIDIEDAPQVSNVACASACVFIFASAKSRNASNLGRWGLFIHRPYTTSVDLKYDQIKDSLLKYKARAISQFERTGVSSQLWDIMMSVPAEDSRRLTKTELSLLGLDQSDPAYQDYLNSLKANALGISKQEYLKRVQIKNECQDKIQSVSGALFDDKYFKDAQKCEEKAGL